jgi:hypothetical protein
MKRTVAISLLCAASFLVACAGPSGPKQAASSGFQLSGQPVSVLEFGLEGAQVTYNAPYDTFGLAIAEEIAAGLRKRGHQAEAVPAGGTAKGSIIVTGDVKRIDAGSRSQRYWVGFGAGAAKFGVEGSVKEAKGKEVASFSDERWSGFGVFGGNSISLVRKCLRVVGQDVAEMIDTGQYRTVVEER